MSDKKEYPMVKVVWFDAVSDDNWMNIEEVHLEPAKIHTLGYLLAEDANQLTVIQNYDDDNDKCSMVMTIPNLWIEKIEYLQVCGDQNSNIVDRLEKPKKLDS